MRCHRRNCFLDIDQSEAFTVFRLFADTQQNGKPQAAASGIHSFHFVIPEDKKRLRLATQPREKGFVLACEIRAKDYGIGGLKGWIFCREWRFRRCRRWRPKVNISVDIPLLTERLNRRRAAGLDRCSLTVKIALLNDPVILL